MRPAASHCASLIVALGCVSAACDSPTGPSLRYRVPEQTSDGWQIASAASVGMDAGPLERLLALVARTEGHRLHGIVVVRHGKLVFEEYWAGRDLDPATLEPVDKDFDRETLHYLASVSKSVTSALGGIALDLGLLHGVTDSLFAYFPEYADLRTEAKAPITLEHLLSFTSGLEWSEGVYGYDDPRDSHYRMFRASDPVRWLLERPVVAGPGTGFAYNSGDTNLLGEVIRRASGTATLVDFARERLFGPLGIQRFEWMRFGSGGKLTFASGGVSLRPRDMAKLGQLYLDGGVWQGRQVVSPGWVQASVRMSAPLAGSYRTLYGYGYNWWLGRSPFRGGRVDYFRAAGWGEQLIYVYPQLDLVVVFTGGAYYETLGLDVNEVLEGYVLAAISDP